MARLFTIKESENLEELEPKSYSTTHPLIRKKGEGFLQDLLAKNPEKLIPWDQILPEEDEEPSVILVKTEAGITKGSIDVLLLGNDGVLTIVEAKLSENTREIRRMMIAQAIEYAAQLYAEWDLTRIQSEGEKYWRKTFDKDFLEEMKKKFDIHSDEEFWRGVDTNVKEGNLRVLYACDEIPKEVRQIIEFLNKFAEFDVYGLEVKIHPRQEEILLTTDLIGPSAAEKAAKEKEREKPSRQLKLWTEDEFRKKLKEDNDENSFSMAIDLLNFGKDLFRDIDPFYSPSKNGSAIFKIDDVNIFTLYHNMLYVQVLNRSNVETIPMDWDTVIEKLNRVGLKKYTEKDLRHSEGFRFSQLTERTLGEFKSFIKWFIGEIKKRDQGQS
ncbi:MAG: hypothetical protein ACPL6D_10250 [Thermodesulfobacteriota bacterium]